MILSVIIVNYNVRCFLEQCLSSVRKAISQSILLREQVELFVVDNASTDGSLPFLQPLFPEFRFITNSENTGFSKANNLPLTRCSGKYVLFLNPDTILAEDSLDQCISFFQSNSDAGAVGVRMIDGKGSFLKESKRGFPSPAASFFKMSGLATAFPSSRIFASYYAGHLDQSSNHPVEILSGAFMMIRKEVLDKTGGFDEQFFMYAEDIDLSYRIRKAGFQNYYLSSTTIIHFKGESTPIDIGNVSQFYHAMHQFMKKHLQGNASSLMLFFLRTGIALRQAFAVIALKFKRKPPPENQRESVFIMGDPENGKLITRAFQDAGIKLAETEATAAEIIFCEGPLQSWKSIIQEMDTRKRGITYSVHGSGTHAIVGSKSKLIL